MKFFLDYLYYKYYYWQIKVGNKDIASVTAMLFIAFITLLFVISIIFLLLMLISSTKHTQDMILSVGNGLFIWGIILVSYSFFFFRKKRYKTIINKNNLKNKSNFWAIALPTLAFILLNLILVVLILQNQGKL